MELARPYIQRGRGHAGLGKQPTRCQLQSRQGTLPAVAVRAVSIDLTEYVSATPITELRGAVRRRWQTTHNTGPLCTDGCSNCSNNRYTSGSARRSRSGRYSHPLDGRPALKKSYLKPKACRSGSCLPWAHLHNASVFIFKF